MGAGGPPAEGQEALPRSCQCCRESCCWSGDKKAWDSVLVCMPSVLPHCRLHDVLVSRAAARKGKERFASVLFVLRTPHARAGGEVLFCYEYDEFTDDSVKQVIKPHF